MKKLFTIALCGLLCMGAAFAQAPNPNAAPDAACEGKAIDKNGKPLVGAAKASFMKKCHANAHHGDMMAACQNKAVGKDGKPLAGAAKNSFMKKCEADAGAAAK